LYGWYYLKIMSSIKHEEEFQVDQPIDILFPLFSDEGEKFWVPGWDYKNIMGSTELHQDYIFVTENHDHASSDAIWLVKQHDPISHYVEFYKVEPEDKVGIIAVRCNSISQSKTNVRASYECIALNEKRNQFITSFTKEDYKEFIGEWKRLLNQYFQA
ncbi:MAG: hypothetical protein WBM41_01350, partial [Arenicellales bacterium]